MQIPDRINQLIDQYLNQTLSESEAAELEAWYRQVGYRKSEWISSRPDEEQEVMRRMEKRVLHAVRSGSDRGFPIRRNLKIAAAVLICFSLSFYLCQLRSNAPKVFVASTTQHENRFVLLPDSSRVLLRPSSTLTVRYSQGLRSVELEGEAFFDVTKSKSRPFLAHTGNLVTKVLGTKFAVNTNQTDQVVVSVKEGRVAVIDQNRSSEMALLHANQGIRVSRKSVEETQASRLTESDVNLELAWVANDMRFNNTSIQEVTEKLERRYDCRIQIQGSDLRNAKISGNFDGTETLDMVIHRITEIIGATYAYHGGIYVIQEKHM